MSIGVGYFTMRNIFQSTHKWIIDWCPSQRLNSLRLVCLHYSSQIVAPSWQNCGLLWCFLKPYLIPFTYRTSFTWSSLSPYAFATSHIWTPKSYLHPRYMSPKHWRDKLIVVNMIQHRHHHNIKNHNMPNLQRPAHKHDVILCCNGLLSQRWPELS